MNCMEFDGGIVVVCDGQPRTVKVGDRAYLKWGDIPLDVEGTIRTINKSDVIIERWNNESVHILMADCAEFQGMQTVISIEEHPRYSLDHVFIVDKSSGLVNFTIKEDKGEVEKTE